MSATEFNSENDVARWVRQQPDGLGPRRLQELVESGRLTAVSKQAARAWLARHPQPPADRPYAKYNTCNARAATPGAARRSWIAGAAVVGVAAVAAVAYAVLERSS